MGGNINENGSGNIGGAGGNSNLFQGGQAGTLVRPIASMGSIGGLTIRPAVNLVRMSDGGRIYGGSGGGGGGGSSIAKGGGGGGGGGIVCIVSPVVMGDGIISVKGGNGSNGQGTNTGGGGGGGGGSIFFMTNYDITVGTNIRLIADGGTGGLGVGNAQNGADGQQGYVYNYTF
jgi:hypothetical protein